jgi:hypothetical protein
MLSSSDARKFSAISKGKADSNAGESRPTKNGKSKARETRDLKDEIDPEQKNRNRKEPDHHCEQQWRLNPTGREATRKPADQSGHKPSQYDDE